MNLILIVLCGILMGAFNLSFFLVGYYFGTTKKEEEGVTLTKDNAEYIKELNEWKNYGR